jgi:hypothetical protein
VFFGSGLIRIPLDQLIRIQPGQNGPHKKRKKRGNQTYFEEILGRVEGKSSLEIGSVSIVNLRTFFTFKPESLFGLDPDSAKRI